MTGMPIANDLEKACGGAAGPRRLTKGTLPKLAQNNICDATRQSPAYAQTGGGRRQ